MGVSFSFFNAVEKNNVGSVGFFKELHNQNLKNIKERKFFFPYNGDSLLSSPGYLLDNYLLPLQVLTIPGTPVGLTLTLVGVTLGAAAFAAKALIELATSNHQAASESFSTANVILSATLGLAVLTLLNPVLDVVSLATRSATTVADLAYSAASSIACSA